MFLVLVGCLLVFKEASAADLHGQVRDGLPPGSARGGGFEVNGESHSSCDKLTTINNKGIGDHRGFAGFLQKKPGFTGGFVEKKFVFCNFRTCFRCGRPGLNMEDERSENRSVNLFHVPPAQARIPNPRSSRQFGVPASAGGTHEEMKATSHRKSAPSRGSAGIAIRRRKHAPSRTNWHTTQLTSHWCGDYVIRVKSPIS